MRIRVAVQFQCMKLAEVTLSWNIITLKYDHYEKAKTMIKENGAYVYETRFLSDIHERLKIKYRGCYTRGK